MTVSSPRITNTVKKTLYKKHSFMKSLQSILKKTMAAMLVLLSFTSYAGIGNGTNLNAGTMILGPGESGSQGIFYFTLTAPTGYYEFSYTTSGSAIASSIKAFPGAGGSGYGALSAFAAGPTGLMIGVAANANAPLCSSETITITFYHQTSMGMQPVYTYTLTLLCKDRSKDNLVYLNSGLYYVGDDAHIYQQYYSGSLNKWVTQAVTPVGGWQNVSVEGWLASSDPSSDQIFFKSTDQHLYNIYKNSSGA
jgi:hypothetical protein